MNYIKHLNYFYNKIQNDSKIAPCQISLYLALFQCWNKQRFENPIYIIRDEVMRLSKITSKSTYHRSMKILHDHGYITYIPSYNPYIGSQIYFNDLSTELNQKTSRNTEQIIEHTSPNNEQVIGQTSPNIGQAISTPIDTAMSTPMSTPIEPIYKHINNKHKNNKHSLSVERENFSKKEDLILENDENKLTGLVDEQMFKKEKSSAKKEKSKIPTLDEVKDFFQQKDAPMLEAEKFFNYFESNGWLVGGKTKMKKWKAAASNWIINAQASTFNPFGIQKPLDTSANKRYDEPL